ncbi:DHA2 family efflux MFS transporter permease subunit [Pelotomaculum isophthalicicum JI]|uniref:DHA2 family efflux MFS transporter permease subunit n=1 Tax=Pelotomaculum isophthalicicum JI TaxID=947010 RepID=A0A9X4JWM6_9FIRM|nr:DHA2 family efflux MFS transporter permease subunit [Pelotomaculum isophthalicicum]MDF9409702.1 DHA2 family efflux MFS transporter permease subunit [Pelotomaculum isophthalicicum JI]
MEQREASQNDSFWLPLLVVVLGAFAAILNNSSINVALPKMMSIFGVSAEDAEWILTAYMLTSGVVIPVTGYLGDRLGTKRVYLICTAIFILGSVLCSLAWNNSSMVAARVIQGIGGGAIMPVSMAIVYRIVPREKIGLALGVWGMAAVCGPAIGPTLGGYIVDHLNWRFLFTMNIPIGVTGLFLAYILLPEGLLRQNLKFDLLGFITSTLGCFTLLLALSEGTKEGWSSYYIVALLTFSFYALLLFVIVELNHDQPMLDLRLFKNGVFSISVFAGSLITIGLYGGVFLIPLFTQDLLFLTPYETGLILMPAAIVTALMMPISGFLFDRFGPKVLAVAGLTLTAWGTLEFHNLSLNTSNYSIMLLAAVRSLGMGLAMMPITTAGMNTVPVNQVGRASALSNVTRQVAGSFGIAILTAVMQNRQVFHYAGLADGMSINSNTVSLLSQLKGYLTYAGVADAGGAAMAVLEGLVAEESLVRAIDDTFIVAALFIFIAIPLAFLLKKPAKKIEAP